MYYHRLPGEPESIQRRAHHVLKDGGDGFSISEYDGSSTSHAAYAYGWVKHGDEWVVMPNSPSNLRPLGRGVAKEEFLNPVAERFDDAIARAGGTLDNNMMIGNESVACIFTADEKYWHDIMGTEGACGTHFCTCNRSCTLSMMRDGLVDKLRCDVPVDKMIGEWAAAAELGEEEWLVRQFAREPTGGSGVQNNRVGRPHGKAVQVDISLTPC